ncbi:HAMP domain-containing protein [Sphingosinithalassobacter tenebrarum]|uniref:histidine kinase n=1 Tax=Stakelama tenebrarum TaxID=2711215 RepID=A0A6G6YAY7_9SPHN|nr:HAMP domain-containing protein [Sphingosinithalassobacter tenebrarum]
MIRGPKEWIKRRWPPLRLRTILFATLFVVAALPGVGAVFLRVYENTLVRQTEAELIAQSAALAASAQALWPGAEPASDRGCDADADIAVPSIRRPASAGCVRPEPSTIDLSSTPILPPRPSPVSTSGDMSPEARAAAETLVPILRRTRQTTLAAIELLDARGRVVAGQDAGRSYADLPEVREALAGRPETVLRRNAGYRQVYLFEWLSRAAAIRIHHVRPIVVDGQVVGVLLLSRSARALFKGLYEDRFKIAFGVLVIFGILVVLSGVLSRGISRPIEALARATRSVAAGGGGGSVPEAPRTAAVEIQALYADFDAMAEAIERRSGYLRDLANAVSHEFKTPIAGIRGAIELLQDHDATMTPEDRRRFLANADADAERLTLLVSRLLDLARADMAPGDPDARSDLRLAVARAEKEARLAVTLDAPEILPQAAVPPVTIDTLLATLLDNSVRAGANAVTVRIAPDTDRLAMDICDNGPGIAPADRKRIFEPFFTTRRADGGSGLGLAIVRSLLRASGATIELVAVEEGTCFRVILPRG